MEFRLLQMVGVSEAVRIGTHLAVRILRGDWAPGDRMPPVREVAHAYGVTVPTAQRALCVPEAWGLIQVRRGRQGSRVLDPQEVAGFELWPLRLEAASGRPAEAARLLGGLLAIRRALLEHLLSGAGQGLELLAGVALGLEAEIAAADTMSAIRRVDLELARRLLQRSGLPDAGAVLASVRRVLDAVPAVTEAMYGDLATARGRLCRLVEAARAGAFDGLDPVAWLEQVDRQTVRRFEQIVAQTRSEDQCAG